MNAKGLEVAETVNCLTVQEMFTEQKLKIKNLNKIQHHFHHHTI